MIKNKKRRGRIFEIENNFECHLTKFYLGVFLFIFLIPTLYAEVNIGGHAETINRYWVSADSGRWTWNEVRTDINLEVTPEDNLHFYSEMRLRN